MYLGLGLGHLNMYMYALRLRAWGFFVCLPRPWYDYSLPCCLLLLPTNVGTYIKIRLPEKLSLKSRGVQPFFFLKIRLKLEILLNPQ